MFYVILRGAFVFKTEDSGNYEACFTEVTWISLVPNSLMMAAFDDPARGGL